MQNKLLNDKVRKYFEESEEDDKQVLNELTLFIYTLESTDSDLFHLAKILSHENLERMISYFDGASIKLPTKEEFRDCLLLSMSYYLIEYKKFTWQDVQNLMLQYVPHQDKEFFKPVSLGKKVSKIKKIIRTELDSMVKSLDHKLILDYLQKLKESKENE